MKTLGQCKGQALFGYESIGHGMGCTEFFSTHCDIENYISSSISFLLAKQSYIQSIPWVILWRFGGAFFFCTQ
jgi:hypothetical protein